MQPPPGPSERNGPERPRWREWLRGGLILGAGVVGVAILGATVFVAGVVIETPGPAELRAARIPKPSLLLAADGQTLTTFRRAQQEPVPLERIAPVVTQALIATEDHRFHEHRGIDVRRTLSALLHTLVGRTQGGSTITQQLARNLFPEQIGRARSATRKLKEMVTAMRIERIYDKQQILEAYLNTAPFLYNVVGIEMAARTYFDKTAAELDTLEAATLVGMLKGTHYYNPVRYPERAHQRRNIVLSQMAKLQLLDAASLRELSAQPVALQFSRPTDDLGVAPHFAAHVRKWLVEWADERDLDIYADGLVIETTLDPKLQEAAARAVERQATALQQVADVEWSRPSASLLAHTTAPYSRRHAKVEPFKHFWQSRPELLPAFVRESAAYRRLRSDGMGDADALRKVLDDAALVAQLRRDKTRLEAGFAAIDPTTGEVKAWVGSRDFARDQFDHVARAERQPGSTFKPFVYGAALQAGMPLDRTFPDLPVEIALPDGSVWRPGDMAGVSGRDVTLYEGLVMSKNSITVQVMQEVGVPAIARLAQAAGIERSRLDAVPSLALGSSPVTLLEMVSAYATIAAHGEHRSPIVVRRIRDQHGRVLADFVPQTRRALSREAAQDLIDMMRGVVAQGTGTAIRSRFGIGADVAGKTGTTQYNTDGWFILMHPTLVAGAWVGFNDQRVTMRSDHWGQGGHNAVLIVGEFFRDATKNKLVNVKKRFPPPRLPLPEIPPQASPEDEAWGIDASAAGIVVDRAANGSVVIGDRPGVAAMRRSAEPQPSPADELAFPPPPVLGRP